MVTGELSLDEDVWSDPASSESMELVDGILQLDPTQIVDDFEWGGPITDRYTIEDSDGVVEIVEEESFDGNHAAKVAGEDGATHIAAYSLPGDGLDHYIERGDTFSTWLWRESGTDGISLTYGVSEDGNYTATGDNDCYMVGIGRDSDYDFFWMLRENGDNLDTISEGPNPPTGAWVKVEIEWTTGDEHNITFYDTNMDELASINTTDSTHASENGVGFTGATSTQTPTLAYVDEIITE